MSGRWRLAVRNDEVSVFVLSLEFGEVLVGKLYLCETDIAELTEMFRGATT